MTRLDSPCRILLATAMLAFGSAPADATTAASPPLSRDRVMDGLDAAFEQTSKTRTPDGRGHLHLKTRDPACAVFVDIDTGITGEFRSAQLLARISERPLWAGLRRSPLSDWRIRARSCLSRPATLRRKARLPS